MLTNVVPDVSMSKNLIEVRNLVKHFEVSNSFFSSKKNIVKAVDGISFNIKPGESLGLVGQSGCGKTTTARSLCLLDPKTSGNVNFFNPEKEIMESIDNIDDDSLKIFRRNIQMIFQDPYESLNPCLLYTSPSPRDAESSRMPSSA